MINNNKKKNKFSIEETIDSKEKLINTLKAIKKWDYDKVKITLGKHHYPGEPWIETSTSFPFYKIYEKNLLFEFHPESILKAICNLDILTIGKKTRSHFRVDLTLDQTKKLIRSLLPEKKEFDPRETLHYGINLHIRDPKWKYVCRESNPERVLELLEIYENA